MKQVGLVVCIAFALGGCAPPVDAPAPAAQREDLATDQVQLPAAPQPAKTVEQEVHCNVETKCLAKLRGIADRSGKTLNLKLANGSTKSFTSTDRCEIAGDRCELTTLVDYRPSQGLFVLSAKYYESFATIIVSRRTGETFRIEDGAAYFSPDGKHFAVVAVSEQDGVNELAIYGTSAFPPVLEWRRKPKSWTTLFEFVAWNGNDQVKLNTLGQNSEANVSRSSTGWKLTPAADD